MNAFAVSFVLIIVTTISMAILSFLKANGRKEVTIWGWLCTLALFWGIGGLIGTTTLSYERAYLGWQIANICSITAPVIFFHFILSFCQRKSRVLLSILYGIAGIFLLINFFFKEIFFGKIRWAFNEFYWIDWSPQSGPLYIIFYISFYWLILFYAFYLLARYLKHSTSLKRNADKYLLLSMGLAWSGAHSDFLSVFNHSIYPYLNFFIAIYPVVAGYAIIRHHLMDIDIVFKKSIIYSVLIALVTLFYLFLIFISEKFFQGVMGYSSTLMSLGTMLIIAILFTPLKNIIQNFVDTRFLKGKPMEIAERNALLMLEVADKEKFKSVAVMASGMAHEIKNPLTAIKTFSEYLPLKMNDPEFLQKFSRIVGKEADRINALVHQLLEFSRPSAPKLEETSVQNLMDEVLDFLNSQCVNYNIKVEKVFQLNGTLLKIDPNQFRQVFLNLFINAIEAMPRGGTLTVETSVGNGLKPFPTDMTITIADTGPGIPPETLKNLFEPFHTTKAKGTGLGLSISKNIIESHGGKIRVESEIGKGTRFMIDLPTGDHCP